MKYRKFITAITAVTLVLSSCGSETVTEMTAESTTVVQSTEMTTVVEVTEATTEAEAVLPEVDKSNIKAANAVWTGQKEVINRGLVAVKTDDGVFLSWRLFDTDTNNTYFRIYRDGKKIVSTGDTNYTDKEGTTQSTYYIEAVLDKKVVDTSETVNTLGTDYIAIKLDVPANGINSENEEYFYKANDASVADLDGDGEYEIILKWDPSNSQDNSSGTVTGNTYIDAYKLDGTKLWRIDLGVNIRSGAHYTQFVVYDFDGDGKAEMAVKTADGTIDGQGNPIGDPSIDNVERGKVNLGMILKGNEYLTVFDGMTGKALDTVDFEEPRGKVILWGDNYGNRVDRFLACAAYLDGQTPSFVMCRGYYAKTTLTAYNFKNGKIEKVWHFDTDEAGKEYTGQGNHNLTVADVDGDYKDEIVYGSLTIDDDGTALYTTKLGHGDAIHVSDLDPSREGLEVFQVHEGTHCSDLHDAMTGEIIWKIEMNKDTGRGMAADIDPTSPGAEMWTAAARKDTGAYGGIMSCKGEVLDKNIQPPMNFTIFWDGDLLSELYDGGELNVGASNAATPYIYKYKALNGGLLDRKIREFKGTTNNNHTKGNPCLIGDILGDWREEVVVRTEDNSELRIYTTTIPTEHRLTTLVQNRQYRLALTWQNTGYNQPPHTSYYIGSDMEITTAFTGKIEE